MNYLIYHKIFKIFKHLVLKYFLSRGLINHDTHLCIYAVTNMSHKLFEHE